MAGESTTTSPQSVDTDPAGPGGAWALQAFEVAGQNAIGVEDPSRFTVEFRDHGRAHVRADCNVCTSSYTVSGSRLSVGLMACTRVACPPGSQELRFVQALESASSFQVTNQTLRLTYADGVMRFAPW